MLLARCFLVGDADSSCAYSTGGALRTVATSITYRRRIENMNLAVYHRDDDDDTALHIIGVPQLVRVLYR